MNDLTALLELATDSIEPPPLAGQALSTAGHRRTRRRVVLATTTAGLLIAGLAVGVQAGSSVRSEEPVSPPAPSSRLPDPSSAPSAPGIDPTVVQPPWDPATATELPPTTTVALPAVLERPADALLLDDAPLEAAVAAVETAAGIGVVDGAGSWRSTPCPEPAADEAVVPVVLSPDGTRLGFLGRGRLWWRDLDGPWHPVSYPTGMDPGAETYGRRLSMPTRGQILVGYDPSTSGTEKSWAVDLGDGRSRALPFQLTQTVAQQGDVTVRMGLEDDGRRLLRTWRGTDAVDPPLDIGALDDLANPVLGPGGVVAGRMVSTYSEPPTGSELDGLLAFDPGDGAARGYLPFAGDDGFGWAIAGVTPVGWVDTDLVLLSVASETDADASLITWDVETGDLARVASYDGSSRLAVATDLLGAS